MGQKPNEGHDSESTSTPRKRLLHKRTLLVVLSLVILPWGLIAIPKTQVAGGGTTGLNVNHSVHGWPFVHLESTEYDVYGNWVNGKFFPGQMPPGLDLAKSAQKSANSYAEGKPAVQLNLRLAREDGQMAEYIGETGFWSESSNWPVWEDKTHLTPRYVGLFLNCCCLFCLAAIVALCCEYRIRSQGGLLKYSLRSLLIGMTLLAIGIGLLIQLHRENVARNRLDLALQRLIDEEHAIYSADRVFEARFPRIVSQLFNHGKHPWGAIPFFRQVKSGTLDVDIFDRCDLKDLSEITKLAKATQYEVILRVMDFSPERQRMLKTMDGINIVDLEIEFDSYDWMSQEFGDDDAIWDAELKRSGFKVDLGIDMSKLETVGLYLDWTIPQVEQLKPFLGLPALKKATINGLSTEGAEFILKTKAQWPKMVEFDFQDDVPEELRKKLESEFVKELPFPDV